MNGLEKIIERIEHDVRGQIAVIEDEARGQAAAISAEYEAAAAREREEILKRGRAAAQEREKRMLSIAALETRKQTLAAKQELIAEAFAAAAARLDELPEEEYVDLLAALAARSAVRGDEEIILSATDRDKLGERITALANQRLTGGALTLSPSSHNLGGGLLLSSGEIKINCTFGSMMQMLRGQVALDVAKVLFD